MQLGPTSETHVVVKGPWGSEPGALDTCRDLFMEQGGTEADFDRWWETGFVGETPVLSPASGDRLVPRPAPSTSRTVTEAEQVMALHRQTGMPVLDCRAALRASSDPEEQLEHLRRAYAADMRPGVTYACPPALWHPMTPEQ